MDIHTWGTECRSAPAHDANDKRVRAFLFHGVDRSHLSRRHSTPKTRINPKIGPNIFSWALRAPEDGGSYHYQPRGPGPLKVFGAMRFWLLAMPWQR